jgi:hypothetical protein
MDLNYCIFPDVPGVPYPYVQTGGISMIYDG